MITRGLHPFGIELEAIDITHVSSDECNTLIDLLGQHGVGAVYLVRHVLFFSHCLSEMRRIVTNDSNNKSNETN